MDNQTPFLLPLPPSSYTPPVPTALLLPPRGIRRGVHHGSERAARHGRRETSKLFVFQPRFTIVFYQCVLFVPTTPPIYNRLVGLLPGCATPCARAAHDTRQCCNRAARSLVGQMCMVFGAKPNAHVNAPPSWAYHCKAEPPRPSQPVHPSLPSYPGSSENSFHPAFVKLKHERGWRGGRGGRRGRGRGGERRRGGRDGEEGETERRREKQRTDSY